MHKTNPKTSCVGCRSQVQTVPMDPTQAKAEPVRHACDISWKSSLRKSGNHHTSRGAGTISKINSRVSTKSWKKEGRRLVQKKLLRTDCNHAAVGREELSLKLSRGKRDGGRSVS